MTKLTIELIFLTGAIAAPSRAFAQTADAGAPIPSPPPLPAPATPTATPTALDSPTPTPPSPDSQSSISGLHQGFYFRSVSGIGYMSLFGDGPAGSASISGFAMTGGIAVGGTIARGFALAGTIFSATTTNTFNGGPFQNVTFTPSGTALPKKAATNAAGNLAALGLQLDWFPDPAGGWHAGASAGLGFVGATNLADDSRLSNVALAGSIFGGHDWWIGRSWSLGLLLVSEAATTASLTDSNRNESGYRLTPLSLGIALSILYY
jgi:hypothetical protein